MQIFESVYNVSLEEGLFLIFPLFCSFFILMLQMAIRKGVADSGSYEPSGPASWGSPLLLVGVNHLLATEASPSLETERFIDYGFHSSPCLALQQHQIKTRQDRGTIKCPASSAFNSSVLHGEVDSSVVGCCFFF